MKIQSIHLFVCFWNLGSFKSLVSWNIILFLKMISFESVFKSFLYQNLNLLLIKFQSTWIKLSPLEKGDLIEFSAFVNVCRQNCLSHFLRNDYYFFQNIHSIFVVNLKSFLHHRSKQFIPIIDKNINFWKPRYKLNSKSILHIKYYPKYFFNPAYQSLRADCFHYPRFKIKHISIINKSQPKLRIKYKTQITISSSSFEKSKAVLSHLFFPEEFYFKNEYKSSIF